MRVFFGATAIAALCGCHTAMLLTPENTTKVVVESKAGSERTFRNMLAAMKECFPSGYTIESNYFPEAREGEVNLAALSETTRVDFAKFVVAPVDASARVTMSRRTNFPDFDRALPAWIDGKDGDCPYGTRYQALYPSQNPYSTSPR